MIWIATYLLVGAVLGVFAVVIGRRAGEFRRLTVGEAWALAVTTFLMLTLAWPLAVIWSVIEHFGEWLVASTSKE